jgi:hypothetical protein
MWEGGVRGLGFVSGYGLSPAVRGTTSSALLHVSDWLYSTVHSIVMFNSPLLNASVHDNIMVCTQNI